MAERLETIARRLVEKKQRRAETAKAAEAADRDYRAEEQLFWEVLADEHGDMKSVEFDLGEGLGRVQFQRRETVTGRILSDEEAEAALRAMGLDDEILAPTRNVRKKVLNEHVRDWIKSGRPLPAGIDFNSRKFITVTRKD